MNSRIIVAHRGLSALYPENTLLAIEQAIAAGARAVEFDVQLTADKIPVLFHDATLDRMTGKSGQIMACSWRQLHNHHASYPERFAELHAGTPIAPLTEAVACFLQWPAVLPCIEIKQESIEYFGMKMCLNRIIKTAKPLLEQMLFLSFNANVIEFLHSLGIRRTGWVLEDYDSRHRISADALQPSVLICAREKLPALAEGLWPGPWDWMVYQTEDPELIEQLLRRGIRYIETDNIKAIAAALPGLFSG